VSWYVITLIVAIALGLFEVARRRRRHARQRTLLRLCWETGVRFAAWDPFPDTLYLPFRLFARGDVRGVDNVIWDPRDPGVRVFDFWFQEDRSRTDLTCAVVPLPFSVPPVAVVARGSRDPSGERVEGGRVQLELEEFDQRFSVWATDPRAAVAFLDQRMMEALLLVPLPVTIHVREDRMLLEAPTLDPGAMLLLLETARALRDRVPRVVSSLYPPRPPVGPFEDRWMQGRWSPEPISVDGTEPA
jgi:hypothetical protein